MSWTAQSFLGTEGNVMMTKDIYFVTGFKCGYDIYNVFHQIKPIRK